MPGWRCRPREGHFGWYDLCLQCGFVKDLKGPDDVGVVLAGGAAVKEREPVSA